MKTFNQPIKISGVGIHSGNLINMTILPSDKYGIFFRRTDMPGTGLIAAKYDNVGDTKMRNTTVGDVARAHVQTIEHLMAALCIVNIDSAIIEINGSEIPILDGSAKEFLRIFRKTETTGHRSYKIVVKKEIVVKKSEIIKQLPIAARAIMLFHDWILGRRNNGFARLTPKSGGLHIIATLDYPDKIIGRQKYEFLFNDSAKSIDVFLSDISSARTFGRHSEWEYLKSRGMARGASKENVIALNDKGDGTINDLIFPDEFVRHQVIDVLGDMYTSGGLIIGQVELYKGGHAMNNLLLKKLFSDPSNYDIIQG